MFLTNVLLLNLLIAKFNSSYETVKEDAEFHYVNNILVILDDYENKSVLPPPLGVILDVGRLLLIWYKKGCKCSCSGQPENNSDCDIFSSSHSSHAYLTAIVRNAIKKHNKEYRRTKIHGEPQDNQFAAP